MNFSQSLSPPVSTNQHRFGICFDFRGKNDHNKYCGTIQHGFLFVKVEFFGENGRGVGKEVLHIPAVFLGGAAQTCGPFYETADAVHLQQVILVLRGYVVHHLGDQFRPYTVLYSLQDLECVSYRGFPYGDGITLLYCLGWLALDSVYLDTSFLACLGGNGACLEDTY